VYSPLLCAARYLKTYRRIDGRFAFFSPCDQKRFEFTVRRENDQEEALVHFNITLEALSDWLTAEGIDAESYPPVEVFGNAGDGIDFSRGLTVEYFGTISGALSAVVPELEYAVSEGLTEARQFHNAESLRRPVFFEPYACVGGCANGSGVPTFLRKKTLKNRVNRPSGEAKAAILERFTRFDRDLKVRDFCHGL
jgi:iron only hydrogenase large subunit-like protein